jgi:heme/copper-type cytochrome/quinol oxidase subunit 2
MQEQIPPPSLPAADAPVDQVRLAQQRKTLIITSIVFVVVLGLIIASVVLLLGAKNETTAKIRDIFIIFMALESLVIGVTLVILIIQLATLINLLQNEIKPILNSTNETVSTLRGTVTFLSDNLAEPVIKLNEYLAGIKRLIDLARPPKR